MPTYEYKCKDHGHIFEVETEDERPAPHRLRDLRRRVERLIGMPTIFCKDSANSPYKKDFRSDPHKWEATCESAFGATKKDKKKKSVKTGTKRTIPGCRGNRGALSDIPLINELWLQFLA